MANIGTVQCSILLTGEQGPQPSQREIADCLLRFRDSYCVPFVLNWTSRTLEVQYGSRGWPGEELEELWSLCQRSAADMWVRLHDSGGDEDLIWSFGWGGNGPREHRLCRYRCDQVRVDGVGQALEGSYLAANSRSDLGSSPSMATPTTSSRAARRAPSQPSDSLAGVLWRASEQRQRVELSWRGRPVQVLDYREGWHFALDHWDNCADQEFLLARELLEATG